MADQSGPRRTETAPFSPIRGLISDSDSQSYPPLEPQEDLQTVGHQLHHSVRQGDPIRPQKPSGPAPLDDSQDFQTVGNQPHHLVRLGDPFRTQTRSCPATLELREDLQTVGTQPHQSVPLRDPFRTQTRRCPATPELQEDLQTVGTQPHHSARLRDPFRPQTLRCPATLFVMLIHLSYTQWDHCPSTWGLKTVSHEAHKITVSHLLNFLFTRPLVDIMTPGSLNITDGSLNITHGSLELLYCSDPETVK
ncbi:unnamed protein product [Gadus morhua 'NCC']